MVGVLVSSNVLLLTLVNRLWGGVDVEGFHARPAVVAPEHLQLGGPMKPTLRHLFGLRNSSRSFFGPCYTVMLVKPTLHCLNA